MADQSDMKAQEVIDALADMFEDGISNGNQVVRFTESVKIGRRYLGIIHKGYTYTIQVDVAKVVIHS